MPTDLYKKINGRLQRIGSLDGGTPPPAATCSGNGIFRPDCDTITIDGDGVLRMDIAAIAREIAEALKPAPPEPDPEQPPVQLPVVASIVNMGVTAGNPANFLCSWSPRNNGTDVLEMEFAADGAFANVLHRRDALVDSVATGITPVPASIWETFPRDVLHVRARVKTPDGEGQWFSTTINTSSWPFPVQVPEPDPTRPGNPTKVSARENKAQNDDEFDTVTFTVTSVPQAGRSIASFVWTCKSAGISEEQVVLATGNTATFTCIWLWCEGQMAKVECCAVDSAGVRSDWEKIYHVTETL